MTSRARTPPPYWRTLGALCRDDAAAVLGISVDALDRMRKTGEVAECRLGRRVVISTREILRLLGEPPAPVPTYPAPPPRPPTRAPLPRHLEKILQESLDRG